MLETVLAIPGLADLALWMKVSRWGYAWVNTTHVAALAVLVGSVVALDLRLMGAARSIDLATASACLGNLAATGLGLAVLTGLLLFLAGPQDYLALPLFLWKIGLVAAGTLHALAMRPRLARMTPAGRFRTGAISLAIWLSVLVSGRMIAFVEG